MDPITARQAAVELRKAGLTESAIATQLGKSRRWVTKWTGRDRKGETMGDRPRSGRPVKLPKT